MVIELVSNIINKHKKKYKNKSTVMIYLDFIRIMF